MPAKANDYGFTIASPGDFRPSRWSLPEIRERSESDPAAASFLRSFSIFSFLVLRRRISGRRLGADMDDSFEKVWDELADQFIPKPPLRLKPRA